MNEVSSSRRRRWGKMKRMFALWEGFRPDAFISGRGDPRHKHRD
ncbi:hypothetical protein GLE_0658 [Lysobacter enzymogenes]|uniref:Uncharacterized protein n=1 Tax=Lysobacter enzymogenes TaxID=69 RepID=A0A0S2DBX4_LYSEN|nr:hypothetical protein GLE_0658 [Lysobacter enzymogenes]